MKEPRSAIILVHGIGDQVQRSTLNSFNGLFRSLSKSPDYSQTLRTLHPNSEKEFNYFSERTEINKTPVVVAEMFWSDCRHPQRLPCNLRNFASWRGCARHHLCELGPDFARHVKDYLVLRVLRCMVCLAFWTIYFPIVAYNVAYGAMFYGCSSSAR